MKKSFIILTFIFSLFPTQRLAAKRHHKCYKDNQLIIILLGLPCSGKGTQGYLLSQELGLPHLSRGDLYRKVKTIPSMNNFFGSFNKKQYNNYPDTIEYGVMMNRMLDKDCSDGLILDSFPKRIMHAQKIYHHYKNRGTFLVFYFTIDDQTLIKRASSRKICQTCNKSFQIENMQQTQFCDQCGNELIERLKQSPEEMQIRIKKSKKELQETLKYFDRKDLLINIDANRPVNEILDELKMWISRFQAGK